MSALSSLERMWELEDHGLQEEEDEAVLMRCGAGGLQLVTLLLVQHVLLQDFKLPLHSLHLLLLLVEQRHHHLLLQQLLVQ